MKIKYIIKNKIKEILKNKVKLFSLCTLFVILIVCSIFAFKYTYAIPEENNYDLFFPERTKELLEPEDLLVMFFMYDDYDNHTEAVDYVFNMTEEEIKNKYYNEIFGTGTIDDQTWSINDYFKEISNGKFYFNPILIGDNKTGIYTIKFNKKYNIENFSSDIKEGFQTLIDKGINTDGFGTHYNGKNKKKILCIFPKIKKEHYGDYLLDENLIAGAVITAYSSIVSITTHELGHAIGLPDLYYQGNLATLMGNISSRKGGVNKRYPYSPLNYYIQNHMDPLHKISLGWANYDLVDKNKTIKLYPTTSSLYNPIIVPTDDNNQYFIIENRNATSFETQITEYASNADIEDPEDAGFDNYEGINVWRVDKLGYEMIQNSTAARKGDFIINVLKYENESFFPKKYSSKDDKTSGLKENTNIKITYIKKNEDNSIDININFDDKYKNSYTVRYNANDGSEKFVDKTYLYTENIQSPGELFSRNDYKLIGWNTKIDGSGQWYYGDIFGYGLTDEKNGIVNLYAQWKLTKIVIRFAANGGIGSMNDITLDETMINDGYILPENQFTNSNPNLKFKGWYVPEYGSVKQPGEKVYLSGDTTLVAEWETDLPNNNWIVSFNSNGGTIVDSQQIINGGLIIEPQPPIKNGYVFGGWYEDETYNIRFWFARPIYSDMTLYAKWIPNENIIKTMDINMEIPTVGNIVTIEKEEEMDFWNWNSQKPQMKINISENEHYHLDDGDGEFNYMHWVTKESFENIMDPFAQEPFIGTFEYNTNYYAKIYFIPNENYIFDENIKVTVNGQNTAKVLSVYDDYLVLGVILTTPEEEKSEKYKILDGANQNYFTETENDLTIKANGEISNFIDLKIDDIIINKNNYTIISGSTIVTLKSSYLKTLLEGTHKITLVYKDGEVSTQFTIKNTEEKDNTDIIPEENETTTKPVVVEEKYNTLSPTTGDNIFLWGILFILADLGIIFTYIYIKKK